MVKPQQHDAFWLQWCKEELQAGRSISIKARGLSMFPLIRSGQEITITPIDFEEIQLNSLIAFQRHTHIVVHRVVEINRKNEGFVMTQGDANFHLDEAITKELLVGGVLLNKPQAQRGPFFKFYVKTLVFFMRLGKRILLKLKKSARSFYPKN